MKDKKLLLMILDGWGLGTVKSADAIQQANTPFVDSLYQMYPHATLTASGEAVGLPNGQMGNSEVGHFTIGAGRINYQELVRINKAIETRELWKNDTLLDAFSYAKKSGVNIHLMGLVSDGGVHSHIEHLKSLCSIAAEQELKNVFIHAFTDGRDTDPKHGLNYLHDLQKFLDKSTGKIASIVGRFYAMDRDNRWERVKLAYDLLVHGIGEKTTNYTEAITSSYNNNITDEFIKPIVCVDKENKPLATIHEGDVVLCFNFRTDRAREITAALTQRDIHEYNLHRMDLRYITMTNYDDSFTNIEVIFDKDNLKNTLGEVLSNHQKKQLRIAETEKYPHVTFFFSGGREKPFEGEKRLLIPSPKVATYDLQPEMSAPAICDATLKELEKKEADFICLNFANPDMVGHTGVFKAVVKAIETVDKCVEKLVKIGTQNGYSFLIIADHGNADYMINEDGSPNTAHTTNLVPCILIDTDFKSVQSGGLSDVAPTILKIMNIEIPDEMKGKSLV